MELIFMIICVVTISLFMPSKKKYNNNKNNSTLSGYEKFDIYNKFNKR